MPDAIDCNNVSLVINCVKDTVITNAHTVAVVCARKFLNTRRPRIFYKLIDMFFYRAGERHDKFEKILLRFIFDYNSVRHKIRLSLFQHP